MCEFDSVGGAGGGGNGCTEAKHESSSDELTLSVRSRLDGRPYEHDHTADLYKELGLHCPHS